MLHRFTGLRHELATDHVSEGVFVRAAARLVEAGYTSLGIDFRGASDSNAQLTCADMTFEGPVAGDFAAMDYLKALNTIDGGDIFVIGWSQSGQVATGDVVRSDIPDAVAVWNAVVDAPQPLAKLWAP